MAKNFKDKTEKELNKALTEAREEVRKFRFSISGAGKKQIKEIREMKNDIARILTELRARELNK